MATLELDDNLPTTGTVTKMVTGSHGQPLQVQEVVTLAWIIRVKGYYDDDGDGLVVTHVTAGGPASHVVSPNGLLQGPLDNGDVITEIDGKPVLNQTDWVLAMNGAANHNKVLLTVIDVNSGDVTKWYVSPLPYPGTSQPSTEQPLLSNLFRKTFDDFAAHQGLGQAWADDLWGKVSEIAVAAKQRVDSMTETERQGLRDRMSTPGGLGLVGLSDFSDAITHFPPTPPGVMLPIKFPPTNQIPFPPSPILLPELVESVAHKVVGFVGGSLESIKESLVQVPLKGMQVLSHFFDRIQTFGELLKDHKYDQAMGKLVEAVVNLVQELVSTVCATIVNAVVDVVPGILGGLLLGRPLTQQEKDFAHGIFGGQINLTLVRVAVVHWESVSGLTAANVIYVRDDNLGEWKTRANYAHELTHVWQDQQLSYPGTVTAAQEHLNHWFGDGHNPYKVELGPNTSWSELGVEEQAQVVENWQNYLDGKKLNDKNIDMEPYNGYYQSVLHDAGFFGL